MYVSSDLHSTARTAVVTHRQDPNRILTFSDLSDPDIIDCTNHPMYRRANEKIEQLKLALFEKTEETKRLKEEISHKD